MTIHALFRFCMNSKRGFTNPILNFTQICVFKISILLSVGFQKMKFGIIHLETCDSTQNCVTLSTAEFRSYFFFMAEQTWHLIVTRRKAASVVYCVKSLMDGAFLPCFVVCDSGTLPASCIKSLTNVSLIVSAMILNHKM
jgi:hypothetical protein